MTEQNVPAETLEDKLCALAHERAYAASLKAAEDHRLRVLENTEEHRDWCNAVRVRRDAEARLAVDEDVVRRAAVERFHLSGDKRPAVGVSIKLFQKVAYNLDAATTWAKEHMAGLLVLDVKRFDRAAKGGILPPDAPVMVTTEPQGSIDSDLSIYMEAKSDA